MTEQNWNLADLWNGKLPATAPKVQPAATPDGDVQALRPYPSKLFVETTTRCNLQCSMCMKQTMGSGLVEGDLTMETFRELDPLFPTAESLVLNGIGEPLLHRRLEEFVRVARSMMPKESWIGFQSNGLLLTERRAVSLMEAGLDRVCVSVDSVSPEMFSAVREGGQLKDVDRAFNALTRAREISNRPDFRIGMEFVVMRDNLRELTSTLRWGASRGVDFAIVSHLLPYDPSFVKNVAYDPSTPAAVELFESWTARAAAEGLDIRDYFRAAFFASNVRRTPEQQRVVSYVRAMMADARQKDIFLNVDQLLQRDASRFAELDRTFAEARAVAEELGIELRLPATAPRDDRSCEFIDNGSIFLSWDGKVHPCYFLWHKFVCYFTNREKFVNTKSFGSIHEEAPLDIWNSAPFRTFREDVIRHDYPFCTNCNLVPCEYLYCEEFTQDCYTNDVPCGDCFWCMGLFNCLS